VPDVAAAFGQRTVVVGADQPFKTFPKMIEYAKKNPVRISTADVGSVGDFYVQTINSVTGANITMVPFQGAMPAVTAIASAPQNPAIAKR